MKNHFTIHRSILKILLGLVIIMAVGVIIFVCLQVSGKNRLYKKSANKKPDLASVSVHWAEEEQGTNEGEAIQQPILVVDEDSDNWEEGDLRYKGVHYRYNEETLTFLFLGIDKNDTVKEAKNGIDGGQSDAIFLLALNPKTKEASLISINRDTMTDIDVYSKSGEFLATTQGQLTLQHGYGDGKELSCERSVAAVSKLFYNMPIHGYCAINYGAIPKINDAVGGVRLTVAEDVADNGKILFREGQNILLKGNDAITFLRARDCDVFGSAGQRTERQKQYLLAYADATREAIKKDVTVMVKLYNTISKYMVTDITIDEVSYFSTQISEYKFDGNHVYSVAGETVMGEKFEEFYPDEKALYELILRVFFDVIED